MILETTRLLTATLVATSLTACAGDLTEEQRDGDLELALSGDNASCDENTDPNCPPSRQPSSPCDENTDPNCPSNTGDPNQPPGSNASDPSNTSCQVLHTDACLAPQVLADAAQSICGENGATATHIEVSAGPACANNANSNSNAATYDEVSFCCQ
jgi:hypothetical protein